MRQLVARVFAIGADPADDEDLRLRKVLLLTAALAILPLAIVWGAVYFAAGAQVAGLIPWLYAALSVLSIGVFSVVRTYWWFGISQLVLYVVLPFLLMWVLGGFVEGSVVGSFAAIAPLGALLLGHRRLAPILLAVYAVLVLITPLVVGSGVLPGLHEPSLPGGLVTAFFIMNLLAVPILGWVLVYAFSGGRQELLSAARGVVRRYFAPDMAAAILADPRRQELGGEMADVTVMFADLGGFTSFAEHHAPAEVVALLNRYFSLVIPAILDEGGTPMQLPGDAVMAVFGAPVAHADHPARACRAAHRILAATDGDGRTEAGMPRFHIGINSGPALVGNIGSDEFRNFTAIGDTTNLAQRLLGLAEPGQVVIGPATAAALGDGVAMRALPAIRVKGRAEAVAPYLLTSGLASTDV
jgi:class 3 adenylate cyclase